MQGSAVSERATSCYTGNFSDVDTGAEFNGEHASTCVRLAEFATREKWKKLADTAHRPNEKEISHGRVSWHLDAVEPAALVGGVEHTARNQCVDPSGEIVRAGDYRNRRRSLMSN